MFIAFNCKIFIVAKGADDIYPVKAGSTFDILYFLSPQGTGVFSL